MPRTPKTPLTRKEKIFCKEYIIDFNGTRSAKAAGYSPVKTNRAATKIMNYPNVKAEIERLIEERSKRIQITGDMVVEELAKLGFNNIQDYITTNNAVVDISKINPDKAKGVAEVSSETIEMGSGKSAIKRTRTKLKLHNKEKVLELLGRHTGIFEKDNSQKSVKIKVTKS